MAKKAAVAATLPIQDISYLIGVLRRTEPFEWLKVSEAIIKVIQYLLQVVAGNTTGAAQLAAGSFGIKSDKALADGLEELLQPANAKAIGGQFAWLIPALLELLKKYLLRQGTEQAA